MVIKDTKPKVVKELLRFLYTGKVQNMDDMAVEMVACADKYILPKLKGKATCVIIKHVQGPVL
jgi:hypothetical protein